MTTSSIQTPTRHVDVLVVGAGLSGIGMGCQLRRLQPGKTFEILEARDAIGGTWDLFRYPGVRSDADLYAFGYGFKSWNRDNSIANAGEIVDYLQETVDEYDLGPRIHLGHKVIDANFSTPDALWTVTVQRASSLDQAARTTRVRNRIRSSTPFSRAVSRTYSRIEGPSAIALALDHGLKE